MSEFASTEIADLQLFADPFEKFHGVPDVSGWEARFVRNGETIAVRRDPSGAIRTLSDRTQRKYHSFRGLLVSPTFADLERLARSQRRHTNHLTNRTTGISKEFLPVAGEIRRSDGFCKPLTLHSVQELLEENGTGLRIFVVDGRAGVGKSHLIEQIVRSRAMPVSYKQGKPLLLHVESRGRALASLSDRIARTLTLLQANFFEEELKPLLRRGAVQIAIDGFDELADSHGNDRSWSALREFIHDLQDQGTCILAGRDAMLDPEVIREGLGNTVTDCEFVYLRLQPPSAGEVRDWLSNHIGWRGEKQAANTFARRSEDSEDLRRPFFVSRFADLGTKCIPDTQGEPITGLMECALRMESEKLTSTAGNISPELTNSLYREVFSEVARMMMVDEKSELEIGLVELLLEEVFSSQASPEIVKALVQRAREVALLEEDVGDVNRRMFPHETVRSYFFSESIFNYFLETGATTGLDRLPLHAEDFRIFNLVARSKPIEEQIRLRKSLHAKLREPSGYDCLRSNLGGLLLAFAPLGDDEFPSEELVLSHLDLHSVWMADLLGPQNISLNHCRIRRLDVRGADLTKVRFVDTEVFELLADSMVRFGSTAPSVTSIVVCEHSRRTRIVDAVTDWIEGHLQKSQGEGANPDERWCLLQRLARISMRQYSIRSLESCGEPTGKNITASPHWPRLRVLLEGHKRLETGVSYDTEGNRTEWFHLVAGKDFLSPGPQSLSSTHENLREMNIDENAR